MVLQLPRGAQCPPLVLVFLVACRHTDLTLKNEVHIERPLMQGSCYRSLAVVVVLGDLCAHVLVPELAQLAHGVVLAGAEEGMTGVLSQVVARQLVRLQGRKE